MRKNAANNKVLKIVSKGGLVWTMDAWLTGNLDVVLNKAIPNKWDCLSVIFGGEGSGKSTIAAQICKYLDPNFSLDNVIFRAEDFEKAVNDAKPETAILWDEAITGATAVNQGSKISKIIIELITQIRFKKLKIILCFPYYDMLQKYFVKRCLFSIYVYATAFDKRGYFMFYTKTQSEFLYNVMKEKFKYSYKGAIKTATHGFKGFFTSYFPLDTKSYEEKKDDHRTNNIIEKNIKRICTHYYKARLKSKDWRCSRCGKIVFKNPFYVGVEFENDKETAKKKNEN